MRLTYQKLKELLKNNGRESELLTPSPDDPTPRLEQETKLKLNDKPVTLKLVLQSPDIMPGMFESSDYFDLLQISFSFPLEVSSVARKCSLRFLSLLNKVAFFPGYNFDEADQHVTFRHSLTLTDKDHSVEYISSTLNALEKQIETFLPALEEVLSGKKSYDSIVAEAKSEMSEELSSSLF